MSERPTSSSPNFDKTIAKEMAMAACKATIASFKRLPVQETSQRIRRTQDNGGFTTYIVQGPHYRQSTGDHTQAARETPEFEALAGWLWKQDTAREYLCRGFGHGPPNEQVWQSLIFSKMVYVPVVRALDDYAVVQLIESDYYEAWAIDDIVLADCVSCEIDEICASPSMVKAICPLFGVSLAGKTLDLCSGFRLAIYTAREDSLHNSRYDTEHRWHEHRMIALGVLFAEIEIPWEPLGAVYQAPHPALPEVASRLDLLRASIFCATGYQTNASEGICIVTARAGLQIGELDRDPTQSHSNFSIGEAEAVVLSDLLPRFADFSRQRPEFRHAVLRLSRSLRASLPADALLEAAIGLEGLLLNSKSDVTYKFKLHGAALLVRTPTSTGSRNWVEEFKGVYEDRSTVAHGSDHGSTVGSKRHQTARELLGRALAAVVQDSEISEALSQSTISVPKAIERVVLARATKTDGPQPPVTS